MKYFVLLILAAISRFSYGVNGDNILILSNLTSSEINTKLNSIKKKEPSFTELIVYNLQGNALNLSGLDSQKFKKVTIVGSENLKVCYIDSKKFPFLKEVNLINLGLEDFPISLLYLENIEKINLSKNRIKRVDLKNNTFWNKISSLDLSFNLGLSIKYQNNSLRSLTELNLSGCGLTISPEFIYELDSLLFLNLSYNRMTKFVIRPNLSTLGYLNLSSNHLDSILMDSSSCTPKLHFVDLGSNNLKYLPDFIYSIKWLSHLDLSYNKMDTLILRDEKSLRNIGYFDLRCNSINYLSMGSLFYDSRTVVNLSGNSLRDTDDSWIYNLSSIYSGASFIVNDEHLRSLFKKFNKEDYLLWEEGTCSN